MDIEALLNETNNAGLTVVQALEPMEGREVPLFPPTYPVSDKNRGHRNDTPYSLNVLKDGRKTVALDSVQSQANRMEASFHADLQEYVPQIRVHAGDRLLMLTELPHRLADASVRATDRGTSIHDAFEAYDAGDPLPIAKLGPTALIYGAWDSRDTGVKIPRLVRSEIHAWDVDVFTRSAQFTGAFKREELGFNEKEWKQGANIGFAPTPSVDQHGGVIVHGAITQTATVHLGQLRQLERATPMLGQYLLALALGGLWHGGRDYDLRTGCWLVPKDSPNVTRISRDGRRDSITISDEHIHAALKRALNIAKDLAIPAGNISEATYAPALGKAMLKTAPAET